MPTRRVACHASDKKTTEYMQRFESLLNDSTNDPYIQHYTNKVPTIGSNSRVFLPLQTSCDFVDTGPISCVSASSRLNLSDRNLLCMSPVLGTSNLAIGGADHGVRVVSPMCGKILYTLKNGHSEWVTSIDSFPDGRIVSGGMDSKICIWNPPGRHEWMNGHVGSISRVRCIGTDHVISSSYDRSIKVWKRNNSPILSLHGHTGAVLDFVVVDNTIVSAGRDSSVRFWDITRGAEVSKFIKHKGHVCSIVQAGYSVILTGGQDGAVCEWDSRIREGLARTHQIFSKNAAVTNLASDASNVIAVGADGSVAVLNSPIAWKGDHDDSFIYSLTVLGKSVLTGGGDGTLAVRTLAGGNLICKIKLDENAIRGIQKCGSQIGAITDDGNFILMKITCGLAHCTYSNIQGGY